MKDFRQLQVWKKSHELVLDIYTITSKFPKNELFGLTSQIRRASSSIPTNIAEGCGRGSDADFCRFLQISMGSASETEYELQLAHDLGYLDDAAYESLNGKVIEVKRMLSSLIIKIKY